MDLYLHSPNTSSWRGAQLIKCTLCVTVLTQHSEPPDDVLRVEMSVVEDLKFVRQLITAWYEANQSMMALCSFYGCAVPFRTSHVKTGV
jgi:hypothetical protein